MRVLRRIDKRTLANLNWPLIGIMLLLCAMGLGVQYSAGYDPDLGYSPPMQRQMAAMAAGLVVFIVCMCLTTSFWRRMSYPLFVVGTLALFGILVGGVVAGGARRWLDVGGFRVQPSEFMKLGMILALARYCSGERAPRDGYTLARLIPPLIIMAIPVSLIIQQPDLGTSLLYLFVGGSMLLLAGIRTGTLLRLTLFAIVLVIPAWNFMLHDYQRERVLNFLTPERDPLGSGYHAIQSKIAVGSGAVTGKGFLEGTQTQLRFLPEQTTDFIFSVLAEEWGFAGSITAISLYGLLILLLLRVGSRCSDAYSAFVSFGVAALIFWHMIINIGMVIGILPVVGLTLTLMSFGGSSVVTLMAALGIVAGFSMRRFMFA
ncbi:MAG: rod shape-determining protein RodA [Bdellovibrionales bacterium]|nr:rod shape-determining protein RodA [Bdellovibrionales bacterium]